MDVLSKLGSTLGRRDQGPNKALAQEILKTEDLEAVGQLRSLLRSEDEWILFDVLKVLEVIGEGNPELVKGVFHDLIPLLEHKKNMIVWIAMSALSLVANFHPAETYGYLARILQIMDEGSVITRDKGMVILIGLYDHQTFREEVTFLIQEQILKAPDNQFGQYVEKWIKVITTADKSALVNILENRLPELTSPSHRKRAEKNLKKLQKR